jgi:hypothetical protein
MVGCVASSLTDGVRDSVHAAKKINKKRFIPNSSLLLLVPPMLALPLFLPRAAWPLIIAPELRSAVTRIDAIIVRHLLCREFAVHVGHVASKLRRHLRH